MPRVGLSVVVAAVVGVSLTGCSSALSSNSSSEQLQALKFESDPPGAEIRTAQSQTCTTPSELKVPSHEQSVTITKDNYVQQTFHVTLGPQPDHSFWEEEQPVSETPTTAATTTESPTRDMTSLLPIFCSARLSR